MRRNVTGADLREICANYETFYAKFCELVPSFPRKLPESVGKQIIVSKFENGLSAVDTKSWDISNVLVMNNNKAN